MNFRIRRPFGPELVKERKIGRWLIEPAAERLVGLVDDPDRAS
jgi:hypothetical protein